MTEKIMPIKPIPLKKTATTSSQNCTEWKEKPSEALTASGGEVNGACCPVC